MKQLLLCLLLFSALVGCKREETVFANGTPTTQPQGLPTVNVLLNGRSFLLEVAADGPTQEQGLMYRDSMPTDHGMLFVFANEQPRFFWMKNTRLPLDILYLDHTGKVVSVATMKPYDLTSVPSNSPAQYAIELNAGVITAVGITPGDTVAIPTLPQR